MENNGFINDIFEDWGEVFDESSEVDRIELYAQLYPHKSCIIDIFPYVIQNSDKYDQVSVFYKKLIDKDIKKKEFLYQETKFVNFVKTLWLYNAVDISYNLFNENYFKKGLKKSKQISPKSAVLLNVNDLKLICNVVSLALREAGFLCLYFKEWKILATIHDFNIQIISKSESVMERVSPIVAACSLFILKDL